MVQPPDWLLQIPPPGPASRPLVPQNLAGPLCFSHHRLCCAKSPQSCPTLWDAMDCSQPGSSVHGISQARILEWVAIFYSRGCSPTQESHSQSLASPALAGGFFTTLPPGKPVPQFCSVAQSCPTLCDPMDCSMSCLPAPYHHPEFAQIHVHCIVYAIQPCHPLTPSSSSPGFFPASGSFLMSPLFPSDDQNTGASASALVLPVNIQG